MLDPWCVRRQGLLRRIKKTAYWHAREKKAMLGSECILFTTERERNLANTTFSIPTRQTVIIPSGVPASPAKIDTPTRPELAIPTGTKAALFLGRIHPKKNLHFLIQAWNKAKIPPNWRLIIAGPCETSYLPELKRMASSCTSDSRIVFVGGVTGDDKAYLLQNCSWFLLPSKQENFGVAVLEAIGNGCPVAISNEVYLADELHPDSEVLPLEQNRWIEFFEKRMSNGKWRAHIKELDAEVSLPKFAISRIATSWVNTMNQIFGAEEATNAALEAAASHS
jgi:glycosyltransferase involved in cell wall biosynthesis